jgi:hypothetical protein
MKTSELTGAALDWAVAKAEGIELSNGCYNRLFDRRAHECGSKNVNPIQPLSRLGTRWADY